MAILAIFLYVSGFTLDAYVFLTTIAEEYTTLNRPCQLS